MSKRLYPHNRVRYWHAYDIDDICALYSDSGLHPQTVRKWCKNGLKTIDQGRPTLIHGYDLISHLKKNNDKNKCKTAFDQIYCMKCRDARHIYQNKIKVEQNHQFLKVNGLCRTCKSSMFKNYKLADFPHIRKKFTLVDVLQLYDCENPSDKTHLSNQQESTVNESKQWSLFNDQ